MKKIVSNGRSLGDKLTTVLMMIFVMFTVPVNTAGAVAYAYVDGINSNVSIIDTESNTIVDTVDIGFHPIGAAIDKAGSNVYFIGNGFFSVFNTSTNTVTDPVNIGGAFQGIAVTPDGKTAYVTDPAGNRIDVIDTATKTVTAWLANNVWPIGIAADPTGTKVYVTNLRSSTVEVIYTATNSYAAFISVGAHPRGITVSPDGAKVFVANTDNDTISVIDTATNTVTNTVIVGSMPRGVAASPDGKRVYVTNYGCNNTSVIDTVSNSVIDSVNVGINPLGVAVTPDGSKVFVANNGDGTVSVINTSTNTVTDTINVGGNPFALGQFIGPDTRQQKYLVSNFTSNITQGYAPLSVQFNDSSENAVNWLWNFGDGSKSTERNPEHTYYSTGNYTVNLTVSNGSKAKSSFAYITVLDPLSCTIDETVTTASEKGSEGNITAAGSIITYQINLVNNGKIDLNNVIVNITNPPVTLKRLNSSQNDDETLNIGEIWDYAVNYTVTQADMNNNGTEGDGFIKNSIVCNCDELTPQSYTVQVPITRSPEYSIFKSVFRPDKSGDCIINSIGDEIPYRIVVKNEGNIDLTNISINDTLINLTGPIGNGTEKKVLHPQEIWEYTGTYALNQNDISKGTNYINNTATVRCDELPEKSSSFSQPIDKNPQLSIYKSVIGIDDTGDHIINEIGDIIQYQVAIKNNGNIDLTGVSLSDPIVTLTKKSGDSKDPGILNPRETWLYTGNYTITQDDMDRAKDGIGFVENTAIVSCNQLPNESSSLELPIIYIPSIVVNPEPENSTALPVANFSTNVTSGYAPLSVQFTDYSQNAVSRSWDFNNDGNADSSDVSPVCTFTTPETYSASLRVYNEHGNSSKNMIITVLKTIDFTNSDSSSSESSSGGGDSEGKAIIVSDSNARDSNDNTNASWVSKMSENNLQRLEKNKGTTEDKVKQTSEQKKASETHSGESMKTSGFETVYGIATLLVAVFRYGRR